MKFPHRKPRPRRSTPLTRRDLLAAGARWAAGAALAAGGALLAGRWWARREDHTCRSRGLCRTCGRSDRCPLPQAASYRAATGRPEPRG